MTKPTTHDLFIGGEWSKADNTERDTIRNPATGDVLAHVAVAGESDVKRALQTAQDAFPAWRGLIATDRADYLYRLIELIQRDTEKLARIITSENGKPLKEARIEVNFAIQLIRFAAENVRRLEGNIIPGSRPGEKILIEKIPHGVVAGISAWNFPLALTARKLGPALAAGNTFVIKPHELTPLSTLALAELSVEAGFPKGVFNVVTGGGVTVGNALVTNPITRLITMTGSTPAGRKIMAAASEGLKEVRLELGGKAPFIVMEDADIDAAVNAAVAARFMNCGQVCTANERTYVHTAVYDEFLKRLRTKVEALKTGNPLDEDTDMGPKISAQELEKVDAMVRKAVEQGAKVELGGRRLTGGAYDRGNFYAPTLLTNVKGDMDIVQNEVFGPVLSLIRVKDFDDAITQANNSRYGLSAYMFTQNLKNIMRMTNELNFGEIYVNREGGEAAQGFHHGYGDSGIGGEDGQYGLEAYVDTKTVYLNA
ncbi:aldehyde dehydrogenase [Komagataeibacter intermedius]|uniref:Aldehyde dehydrogenase n=2 Tax=Komagataeibacter intermedius TaxID=66229 RepID=A0A0N1FCP3_9PROT|nr:aldehyde dehydrogenase [Komagataeibacter intermedius]KPH87499.1 aldehyde dehydrogenase [Komagataeibacter intermedius AF2]MCF3636218.1 aldehyde dehydrogenase [Komagataeibacter intermedius]GAN86211.1 aldehyde/betaine dehydrogenase [Komagataeibacter intermedius TF2]GBQ64116.1 aldehyde dehydrogenase [Komagataeibacter intermedius NRIC 0521]